MPDRFVDASVFVHAYLRPKRELRSDERAVKANARAIVTRIGQGEGVMTSVVHLAEVANILEDWMPPSDAQVIQRGLCTRDNIEVLSAGRADLVEAISLGSEVAVGTSDALAVVLMRRRNLEEIYSFDRDFDRFENLRRVSK